MKFKGVLLSFVMLAGVLSGCSQKEATPEKTEKKVLVVGTEGAYAPFTYKDEKGELTGYDVEVVKEVGKRADLEVKFVPTPWDSMFLGLESKKFDMVANQISKNPDCEKKYDFTGDYLVSGAQIIVREGRTDIKSLEDLKGKKVGTEAGSNHNKRLLDFDTKKEIDLKYYEGGSAIVMEDIASGRIDATVNDRLLVGYNAKQKGMKVQLAGEPLELIPSYFVFRKENKDLQDKVNKALDEMKKDGSLAALSTKWFGSDFTKK